MNDPAQWFLLAPRNAAKWRGCFHLKCWIDDESGNMHSKALLHYPTEPCTVPHDEIPPDANE